MSNYQKMISDMLNKINDKYKVLDKVSEKLSKYPKLDKINIKLNKYIKKNNPVKVKPELVYNHQAVEASMAVKMLKLKFKQHTNQGEKNVIDLNKSKNNYEGFLIYIKQCEESGIPFPTKSIESDLEIGRNKRLEYCGRAVEDGHLYKPTPTSFDYISNQKGV